MIENILVSYSLFFSKFFPVAVGLGILLGLLIALRRKRGMRMSPFRDGWVVRHERSTMITHWLNAAGMITCLITGMFLLEWIKTSTKLPTLYLIHYIGAVGIILAVAMFLSQQGVSGGKGLLATRADLGKAFTEIFEYAGILGDKGVLGFNGWRLPGFIRAPLSGALSKIGIKDEAPMGKYLSVEKIFSFPVWAVLIAGIVLTGAVKTIKYIYHVPEGFLYWATTVHDFLTYLVIIMLVLHVAAVALVKTNWPLLKSMFTSTIREDYVKEHHSLWYQEIEKER